MIPWARIKAIWAAWRDPLDVDFDSDFPNSDGWTDRIPLDSDCPDTQPTTPGALDEVPDHDPDFGLRPVWADTRKRD